MKKIVFSLLLAIPFTVLAQKAVDRSVAPKPGPAPVITIKTPATFTLPNGLKVFVVQNNKLPRVAVTLTIERMPIVEGQKAGMVSMAGQLIRRGTTKMNKADLDEAIDFLGADINASATNVVATSLTSNFDKTFDLFAQVALSPAFSADELEKIRKQTLSGIAQAKEDPNSIARNVAAVVTYGEKHPYGEIETEETVKNVNVNDVKKYYNTYWKPNASYLIFVGDIVPAKAFALANKYFGKWQKGTLPTVNYAMPALPAKTQIAIVDRPASVQSVINITAPIALKPNSPDLIAASVASNLLGGGSSARLYKTLREKYGFTYGAYASMSPDKVTGTFTASASVRNEKTDSAIGQFINEFQIFRNTQATADEINQTKNESSGSFARSLENPATIANFALNVARYQLPANYYQNYLKTLAAVDANLVQAIAQKYLPVNNLHIVIVGNAKQIAAGLEKYGEIKYYNTEGKPVEAPGSKKADASVTGESLIKKMIEVSGGLQAWQTIKDVTVKGSANIMGNPLSYEQQYILPGVFMQSISFQGMTVMKQLANNGSYSVSQQGQQVPVGEEDKEELDEESYLITEVAYLQKGGYQFTVTGIEAVDGKDAYAVEIKSPKGRVFTNYYDVKSGLKVKMLTLQDGPQGKMPVQTYYKSYKAYNGVQIPDALLVDQGQFKIELTAKEISVNKGLKPADVK